MQDKRTKDNLLINFFNTNPQSIKESRSSIARTLGINRGTVANFIERSFSEEQIEAMLRGTPPNLIIKPKSTTTTSEYSDLDKLDDPKTFDEYCEFYHIPTNSITSAKFVNHHGQEAWNVVCDFTQITELELDEYFERLKTSLAVQIPAVTIPEIDRSEDLIGYHMYYADKHVGAKTRDNSIYKNDWDANKLRSRLMKSLEDLKHTVAYFGTLDKILICDLGDPVDGWDGKTTRKSAHSLPQNMDNRETFDNYVVTMIEWFDTIIALGYTDEYEFICTSNDNHGGAFSYIVNRTVEIWLNTKYPQIKTTISTKFVEPYIYGVHAFLLTHGKDEEDMKSGLPLNLDQKTESWFDDYLINNKLLEYECHVIKGDLHQEALNYGKRFRYRNVLSLYGSSAWMMTNFGSGQAGLSNELVWKNRAKVMPSLVKLN